MPDPTDPQQIDHVDITPSPRVLEMLGEIEFAPWRAAAEIVDNAADALLATIRNDPDAEGTFRTNLVMPRQNDPPAEAQFVVTDTGPGMTLEQLNNAVRAGWTGNDPFENLGLFGMGFNIATARLGYRTRVLTTPEGDDQWIGVEIDLRSLQETGTFEAPVIREDKDDPDVHGTRVEVSKLRAGNYEDLVRSPKRTRDQLGDVYAPLLLEHPQIDLRVNNVQVEPRKYCTWDPEREVTYGSGRNAELIPAVIEFDEQLPDQAACRVCRRWQNPANQECEYCGADDLMVRERRIRGWVGVQRYLDPTDYGIDVVRNGRKILIRDKSLFRWSDPNDISGTEHIEYPIEPPANEGRIVGEVHIDHAPIDYKKMR